MLILPDTTRLEILLATAGTTVQFSSSAVDDNATVLSYYTLAGASNGTTPVTIVGAPSSGVLRTVRYLEIVNTDASVTHTVTIRQDVSGTTRVTRSYQLPPGAGVFYSGPEGWKVLEKNGSERVKETATANNGRILSLMKVGTAADTVAYWYTHLKDTGVPSAFTFGSPGVNGRAVNGRSEVGVPYIPAPVGTSWYMMDTEVAGTVQQVNQLYDLLWINSGLVVTTTTIQSFTTPTLPARDTEGGTNGAGCMIGMIFTTAATNAAVISNSTITYTNSAGAGTRKATLAAVAGAQIPTTPAIGTIVWFMLQAGDIGVRSIESITLNTSLVTGTISLCIAKPLTTYPTGLVNTATQCILPKTGVFLGSDPCLFQVYQAASVTATVTTTSITIEDR